MEGIYYKQMFSKRNGCFSIVEVLSWFGDEVLLEDLKTGLRYVIDSDNFLKHHRMLTYECDISKYSGTDLSSILED